MDRARLEELRGAYRDGLLGDTLPFWIEHAIDREHGGFQFCLGRDGSVIDTDKGIWQHGRFTWLLATLYTRVEEREEWYELCRHGIEFLRAHAFDTDGRMFFQVDREGRPLRKRRYVYTECFGALAFAAWARISGEERAVNESHELFEIALRHSTPPKVDPATRPTRGIGMPMIRLGVAQELRRLLGDAAPEATTWIDEAIVEIRRYFVNHEHQVVLEQVGPQGEILDHFDGRTLNPGHAIECAWFLLQEARERGPSHPDTPGLIETGTTMLDWMWARGWDEEHGGLFYFRDLHGLPVQEYWHDMKFWWPHNEAVIATLMAHSLTGEAKYADWHRLVHDWSHEHFPDPVHGEWFGYLHRDGRRSVDLKGNLWKGPFHLPRMQLTAWELVEEMLGT